MLKIACKLNFWSMFVGIVFAVSISSATAATHVALVIGNSKYASERPLKNPFNDAQDIAGTLTELGYEVDVLFDGGYDDMRNALNNLSSKAQRAEVAIIYFAGHGIEITRSNYLVPVDAELKNASQVLYQTIPLEMMTNAVSGASKLKLVMLDACRNNPFLQQIKQSGGGKRATLSRGLAAPPEDTGATLISFAAKEGTTASDGEANDRNSPYAEQFLKYAQQPNLDIGRMFRNLRDGVLKKTNQNQEPVLYGSLPAGDIYLQQSSAEFSTNHNTNNGSEGSSSNSANLRTTNEAKEMWEAVQNSESIELLEVLIAEYPDSIYAKLANAKIRTLSQNQTTENFVTGNGVNGIQTQQESLEQEDFSWKLAIFNNLDLFGSDIYPKGLQASNLDECSNQCGQNLSCRAFTWNQQASRCFLKTGFSFAQVFEGAVAGLYYRGRQNRTIRADWHIYDNSDLGGVDLGNSRAQSYEQCIDSCNYQNGCNGFAFVHFTKKQRQCWLKTGSVYGPVYNSNARRGITSGMKINRMISPSNVINVYSR